MAANEIHMNDVGTKFLVTVTDGTTAVDISSATTKQLIFQKPSGTKLTKATAFTSDGTDGKMQYISRTILTKLEVTNFRQSSNI